MNSAADMAIKVTVDEPYSAEVTMEQVRAYLREKGWEKRAEDDFGKSLAGTVEIWQPMGSGAEPFCFVWATPMYWGKWGKADAHRIRSAVEKVARHEGRSPASVLREIAGAERSVPWIWTGDPIVRAARAYADAWRKREAAVARPDWIREDWNPGEKELLSSLTVDRNAAHAALLAAVDGQPREKSSVEVRADEIEAEAAKQQRPLTFEDAMRFASEAHEDVARALGEKSRDSRRTDAAAWLLVAHHMLAPEAGR